MNSYYLQFGLTDDRPDTPSGVDIEEPRFFLDGHVHKNATPHVEVRADSWIQARDMPEITEYTPPIYFK
jgi:hypothetical protein